MNRIVTVLLIILALIIVLGTACSNGGGAASPRIESGESQATSSAAGSAALRGMSGTAPAGVHASARAGGRTELTARVGIASPQATSFSLANDRRSLSGPGLNS